MKKIFLTFFLLVVAAIVFVLLEKTTLFDFSDGGKIEQLKPLSPKDISVAIQGEIFELKNGVVEKETVLGSATKNIVRVFGEPVLGDLDSDGDSDVAILLENNPGGSGTFYYAVLAINNGTDGYEATNTMYLGDRIAPQTVEVHDGRAVFNYAERKTGEPMTAQPSVGKSVWINLDKNTGQIGEWVKDFEGEADTSRMKLDMKTWNWVKTVYNDGKVVTPRSLDKFNLTLKNDNIFSAKTDCNGVGGEYLVSGSKIKFDKMMSTLMYCDGSQEQEFSKMIGEVETYKFTSKGELVLGLKMDSGSMIFR